MQPNMTKGYAARIRLTTPPPILPGASLKNYHSAYRLLKLKELVSSKLPTMMMRRMSITRRGEQEEHEEEETEIIESLGSAKGIGDTRLFANYQLWNNLDSGALESLDGIQSEPGTRLLFNFGTTC
ncbi:MAG: hypothetical protein ACI80L_000825 [Pseudohongiellaceae bacterium]|jgi:hypothetical protein